MPAPSFPIAPSPAPDGSDILQHNTQHVAQGLGRLITQYRDKARMRALLTIFLEEVQEVEDALWSLYAARDPSTLNTALQDVIGRIVKQPRRGQDNATYALFLKAKILVNKSRGTGPDLIKIAQILLGSIVFSYDEEAPAAVVFTVSDVLTLDAQAIFNLLDHARQAGVRLFFTWRSTVNSFTFAEDTTPTTSTTLGFQGLDGSGFDNGTGGAFDNTYATED